MNTYTAKDVNGNEVELSQDEMYRLYKAYQRECYEEDIDLKLEVVCEDEDLDMDDISPATIKAIVDEYQDSRERDESWSYDAGTAIDRFIDDIREDCKQADKSRTAPSVERE